MTRSLPRRRGRSKAYCRSGRRSSNTRTTSAGARRPRRRRAPCAILTQPRGNSPLPGFSCRMPQHGALAQDFGTGEQDRPSRFCLCSLVNMVGHLSDLLPGLGRPGNGAAFLVATLPAARRLNSARRIAGRYAYQRLAQPALCRRIGRSRQRQASERCRPRGRGDFPVGTCRASAATNEAHSPRFPVTETIPCHERAVFTSGFGCG